MPLLDIFNSTEKAIVDEGDYERCRALTWHCLPISKRRTVGHIISRNGGNGGRTRYLHRFILGTVPDGLMVDHINGNVFDNRRENLRFVNASLNGVNIHHLRPDNHSGVRGVYWDKRLSKWNTHICANGKHLYLGLYRTIEEATAARRAAELRLFGEQCPIPAEIR